MTRIAHIGSGLHDGVTLHRDRALVVEGDRIAGLPRIEDLPRDIPKKRHDGLICPAFVDLQANGGGGLMFNGNADIRGLHQIARAHAQIGTGALLPTFITDTPERTRAAVRAVRNIIEAADTIVAGLHLEGPHLSIAKRGAHDPELIRPMTAEDHAFLCEVARSLPTFMVTLAPESVTPEQIARLVEAGVIVSLGHSDADYETCRTAFRAGASCVTHLFNAMSQMGHRAPGLVGAALDTTGVSLGLIADGHHVHPAVIRAALRAAPDRVFLVSDAMATAGSDILRFTLNGRVVRRSDGRLTLEDGTLAGADLEPGRAISFLSGEVGWSLEAAVEMATSRPASLLRVSIGAGHICPGDTARATVLSHDGCARRLET